MIKTATVFVISPRNRSHQKFPLILKIFRFFVRFDIFSQKTGKIQKIQFFGRSRKFPHVWGKFPHVWGKFPHVWGKFPHVSGNSRTFRENSRTFPENSRTFRFSGVFSFFFVFFVFFSDFAIFVCFGGHALHNCKPPKF